MPRIKKSSAPRTIPFYGRSDASLVSVALDRFRGFIAVAGGVSDPQAAGAMLHLELALNLLEARNKTLNSIYWNAAPAEVRRNVYAQVLVVEQMVLSNLFEFGRLWDGYLDSLNGQDVVFPVPDYMSAIPEGAGINQRIKTREIGQSIFQLQKIHEQIEGRANGAG